MYINNSYGVIACGSRIGRATKTNADGARDSSVIYDNHCASCAGKEFTVVNTGYGESIGVIVYLHVENMSVALIVVKNNRNNYFVTNICIHGCCFKDCNIAGNGGFRSRSDGSGSYVAAAYDLNCIEVDGEHVGYIVMTECDLNVLTCISTGVNSLLYVFTGTYEVVKLFAPRCAAVCGDINANGFCCIIGILTCHVEANCAACYKFRSDQPVIRSERSNIVDVGLGVHHTKSFVDVHFYVVHPLPVVAVAVLINHCPALCYGIFLKVPAVANGTRSGRSRGDGSRSGGSGSNAAANYFNVGCVILTKEIYMEVVSITAYKLVIVCTTANITLISCDPDTITGGGVSNTPVIDACGDLNSNGIAANYVAGAEVTVCIYGNLILEFIVNACGSIAAGGQRSSCREYIAIGICICIEEHLITGTIAPYIFNFKDNGCSGSVRITILCLDGGIGIDSASVVVPTSELITFMGGRGGEIALIENGACSYGNRTNSAIIETINEGYGEVGHYGIRNFNIIENHETGNFAACAINSTDMAKSSNFCGLGIYDVEVICAILIVLCPEELMSVHVVSDGLDVLHGYAGEAYESQSSGIKVNSVEVTFIRNSVCNAVLIDSQSHDGISATECADLSQSTNASVYPVKGTTACIVCSYSVHFIAGIVKCHSNNGAVCTYAGVDGICEVAILNHEVASIGILNVVETINGIACIGSCKGGYSSAEVSNSGGIVICECTPATSIAGIIGVKCDVTNKINGGESFGYGYGSTAGNAAINGGNSDGGGAFCDTTNFTICVYGCDVSIGGSKGNALVVSLCGKYCVLYVYSTICGNGYILNLNGGGVYGFANIYVINSRIVAGLINGVVLLVGPLNGMFACGKSGCISGPALYNAPLGDLSAIDVKVQTIPNCAGSFTE